MHFVFYRGADREQVIPISPGNQGERRLFGRSSEASSRGFAIPSCFTNPNSLVNRIGLDNRIGLGFAIAKINGFRFDFPKPVESRGFWREREQKKRDGQDKQVPLKFSPSRLKVAGFGMNAAFSWGNRHDKPFPIRFSPSRSPVLA